MSSLASVLRPSITAEVPRMDLKCSTWDGERAVKAGLRSRLG